MSNPTSNVVADVSELKRLAAHYGGYTEKIMRQAATEIEQSRAGETEGYPGIAHDFEQMRMKLRDAHAELRRLDGTGGECRCRFCSPAETTCQEGPFVVADGGSRGEHRFRCIKQGFSQWTLDLDEALQFARRKDAEAYAAEDEDAWHILPVGRIRAEKATGEGTT